MNLSKKILSFVMVAVLCCVSITVPNDAKAETETNISIFDEIKEADVSEKELEEIAKTALKDGEKAADKINQYTDDIDYEAALDCALNAYYGNENFDELENFEDTIDSRSDEIVEAYKEAAKEREIGDANGYEAGKVLLCVDGDATTKEIEALVEAENGECEEIVKCFNDKYMVVVSTSLGQTVDMAEKAYSKYSITESTAKNEYVELAATEVSEYVNDENSRNQYYLDNINAKEAWDYVSQTTHEKVLVGVIDTGVQIDHYDMQNVVSPKSADVTGSTPVLLSECDVTDTTGHGTMVSGVLAAEANNNSYIAGVASCYNNDVVEILAVQASTYYSDTGSYRFASENVVKALNYCVEQGVKVINFSAGALTSTSFYEDLIDDLTSKGIIYVCAGGNDGVSDPFMPADLDKTISVVGTDINNALWSSTNYGMKKDICAPASEITTINRKNGLTVSRGTSLATPMVSAVIAMMCSVNSNIDYIDARRILADTAMDINVGNKCRNGLLNAEGAVKLADVYESSNAKNLSLNKPVTVSSTYNTSFPATNIVDGATNTKWISESTDGQSVTIDLEDTYLVENINVKYDRYIVSGLKVEISVNGVTWKELSNDNVKTLYSSDVLAGATRARYVKLSYTGNTSYVIITEVTVTGYDILTEETTPDMDPREVFGQVLRSIGNDDINVTWGSNEHMESLGQLYNVYIDDEKMLSNVVCGSYDFFDVPSGTHTVKITSVFNGKESQGVTIQFISKEDTTTEYETGINGFVTANPGWNELDYWSVYFAPDWGNNPTGSYRDGGSYSDFDIYVSKESGIDWAIQLKTKLLETTIGKTYICKVAADFNLNTNSTIVFKDEGTQVNKTYTLTQGINNFEIEFTPTANNTQIFFDLGKLPVGSNFMIESFSLEEKVEATTTEEPTVVETTTEEITTEEITTEEPTVIETTTEEQTEEITTKVVNTLDNGIEMNGFQISATVGGMRAVYSVDSQINGKNVVSSGLIYSLSDYADETELYVGSENTYVRSFASTAAGKSDTLFSDSDIATSYAMTMRFGANTAAEYSANWRVRAYAKLEDGTYVYTNTYTYTIYDIADQLYQGCMMNTKEHHDYLYTKILSIVNIQYKEKDYDWSKVVAGK